jgi:hypothetical protein
MTGKKRAGSMETIMIVRVDRLHIRREEFETWLENFLSSLETCWRTSYRVSKCSQACIFSRDTSTSH